MMDTLLSLLSGVGTVLDTPGALTRGAIGNVGDLLHWQDRSPMRASGRQMLESLGLLDANDENRFEAGDVLGTAADIAVDPLNILGAGIFGKALSKVSKANAASDALRLAGGMPQEVVDRLRPEMLESPGVPRKWYKGVDEKGIELRNLEPTGDNGSHSGGTLHGIEFTLDKNRANRDAVFTNWDGSTDEDKSGAVIAAFLDAQNPWIRPRNEATMHTAREQGILNRPLDLKVRELDEQVAKMTEREKNAVPKPTGKKLPKGERVKLDKQKVLFNPNDISYMFDELTPEQLALLTPQKRLHRAHAMANEDAPQELADALMGHGYDSTIGGKIAPGPYDDALQAYNDQMERWMHPQPGVERPRAPDLHDVADRITLLDKSKAYLPYVVPRKQPMPGIPADMLYAILGRNALQQSQKLDPREEVM